MAFTDRIREVAHQATGGTSRPATYLVPGWVRVRAEDFGLLFYDTRSTRLTFVRSDARLVPPPFTGAQRVLGVRAGNAASGDDVASGRAAAPSGAAIVMPETPGAAIAADGMAAGDAAGSVMAAGDAALFRLLDDLVARGLLVIAEAETPGEG